MQQQLVAAVDLLRTLPPSILSSVVEGTGQSAEDLLRKLQGIEGESVPVEEATAAPAVGQEGETPSAAVETSAEAAPAESDKETPDT